MLVALSVKFPLPVAVVLVGSPVLMVLTGIASTLEEADAESVVLEVVVVSVGAK